MQMSLWRSTMFRLPLAFAMVMAVSMSALLYLNYWQSANYTATQADYNISWQFEFFSALPASQVAQRIETEISNEMRSPTNYYGLFTADRRWIVGNVTAIPSNVQPDGEGVWSKPELAGTVAERPAYMRTRATRLPNGEILVVSRDVSEMARLRKTMLGGLAWSAAIVLLGGLGVGALVSAARLRHVNALRMAAQRIARGDLDQRLPVHGDDEIAWLAQIVNHMLDEITRLMREVKGACDGIAHDLRTPMIHVRSLIARISAETLDGESARAIVQALEATDDVLDRFAALLRISEIEAMSRRSAFTEVSLDGLAQRVAELYTPVANASDIELKLDLQSVPMVRADQPLLFEAIVNLLDNAIKFTPAGGHIRLSVVKCDQGARIAIEDSGPGIAEGERVAVMQRFYRSERTREVPGSGLGLSVVQAVMHLHDFGLTLDDAKPGLRVTIDCWAYRSAA